MKKKEERERINEEKRKDWDNGYKCFFSGFQQHRIPSYFSPIHLYPKGIKKWYFVKRTKKQLGEGKKKGKKNYHLLAGEMVCTKELTGGKEAYINSPTSGMFTSVFLLVIFSFGHPLLYK
jgi:hypothetical protein